MSNIPFKIHMFVFSWDLYLSVMQYLEHIKLLEYLMGVKHEVGSNADAEDHF